MGKKLLLYIWVLLAAISSGTLLCLALPLGEQSYLAWMMLIPLLIATKKQGFLIGFIGGLGAVFWCAYLATTGVFYHHKYVEGLPTWVYTVCGIFAASFSLSFGIYGEQKKSEKPIWWMAAIAVASEAILLFEIPAHVALTQYRNWAMMLVASVGGVWMVSFLIWLVNLYVAGNLRKRWPVGIGICLVGAITTWTQPFAKEPNMGITVGAAQVSDGLEQELLAAHRSATLTNSSFVVWPEFSGMLFTRGGDDFKLKEISKDSVPFVTSFRDDADPLPHSVAAMFAMGRESERYEKRKLFGSESKMHAPGHRAVAVPILWRTEKLGLNICYDSCFPAMIRETANLPNVNVIALPTIDPDSVHYFMAAMHAAYTPFRASEEGIAIVRADGNYGSMVVNEHGAILKELKNQQGLMTANISGHRIRTLVGTFGDWFLYGCLVTSFGYPLATALRRRKNKSQFLQNGDQTHEEPALQ